MLYCTLLISLEKYRNVKVISTDKSFNQVTIFRSGMHPQIPVFLVALRQCGVFVFI